MDLEPFSWQMACGIEPYGTYHLHDSLERTSPCHRLLSVCWILLEVRRQVLMYLFCKPHSKHLPTTLPIRHSVPPQISDRDRSVKDCINSHVMLRWMVWWDFMDFVVSSVLIVNAPVSWQMGKSSTEENSRKKTSWYHIRSHIPTQKLKLIGGSPI